MSNINVNINPLPFPYASSAAGGDVSGMNMGVGIAEMERASVELRQSETELLEEVARASRDSLRSAQSDLIPDEHKHALEDRQVDDIGGGCMNNASGTCVGGTSVHGTGMHTDNRKSLDEALELIMRESQHEQDQHAASQVDPLRESQHEQDQHAASQVDPLRSHPDPKSTIL